MDTPYSAKFSFYGFGVRVKCRDAETLEDIKRDYSFFLSDKADIKVSFEVSSEAPDYSAFPPAKAYSYTQHSISYRHKGTFFVDYLGKGLKVIDRHKKIHKVFCADAHLRHEIVFLSILSLLGQYFDSRGMHRVHGLGFEVKNKAVLILLPSGGGKTTFLMDVIKDGSIKLISEDSPIIDSSGRVFPFPIRIGVLKEDKPDDIPDEHLHLIKRMDNRPKYTIDINFFKNKVSDKPLPVQYIFCGERRLGYESCIKPLPKYGAFKEFMKNLVVGLGLYQGVDFLVQKGMFEFFKKGIVLSSRFKNACKVISGSKTYSFAMGFDRKKNVETFLDFCRESIT